MNIYSIGKKLTERELSLSDENILITLTDEEWAGDDFRNLPHHKKVVEQAAHTTGVHVQLFPNCVLGTLFILQKGNQNGLPCPLSFYFNESRFYFVGNQNVIGKLIHRANKNTLPENTTVKSILGVFINLLVDEDNVFFTGLENSLKKTEQAVLENPEESLMIKLNTFRKELRVYKTLYGQLSALSLTVQSNPYKMLSTEQCAEYAHLGVRATLICEQIKDLTEYALQIKDVYQSQIDMKQTRAMNMLTIVSSIFLPLTLITGWYGMNFIHMSELKWAFSYPTVIALAVISGVVEIWIFKKKNLFK